MSRWNWGLGVLLAIGALLGARTEAEASLKPAGPRTVISLDGTWKIAQGPLETPPAQFDRSVPVPGLVDLATPAFTEIGKKSPQRQAFWYRRAFTVPGKLPATALLKLHKVRYGARIWLNGTLVGDQPACFTPAVFDVRTLLKGEGQENELIIRVGADRDSIPASVPSGWDFEKYLYIPGIYDSVELILTGAPWIANIQIVPDLERQAVRVVAEIEGMPAGGLPFQASVTEAKSGKTVASKPGAAKTATTDPKKIDVTLELPGCQPWSPENPFLYELTLAVGGDSGDAARTRFGMRSFTFDPQTRRALLNGKPYYLRGTNVTLYRFFEDALRANLPWRADWVRALHEKFKTMHWNAIRYCIGFAPEFWYDIADELGFLIQDEFPIWLLSKSPENPQADQIIPQYIAWMRERWNHPCVVIWDGQNESTTRETGKAIRAVRDRDLSRRPWENGWGEPIRPTDCVEAHPYLFNRILYGKPPNPFTLADLAKTSPEPRLQPFQKELPVAIIINEYDWLWLTRDGQPTCLTGEIYENVLGKNATVEQRRVWHARTVAALTEFWRGHRQAAGVLHFCSLGYSRPGDKPRPEGGATSDDFIDLNKLIFEPNFEKYVRDAFHPIGLMIDFWAPSLPAHEERTIPVSVINDLSSPWKGPVTLRWLQGEQSVSAVESPVALEPYGKAVISVKLRTPREPGSYTLAAEIRAADGTMVRSLRDVKIVRP